MIISSCTAPLFSLLAGGRTWGGEGALLQEAIDRVMQAWQHRAISNSDRPPPLVDEDVDSLNTGGEACLNATSRDDGPKVLRADALRD